MRCGGSFDQASAAMMGRVRPMAYRMKVRSTPGLIVVHLPDHAMCLWDSALVRTNSSCPLLILMEAVVVPVPVTLNRRWMEAVVVQGNLIFLFSILPLLLSEVQPPDNLVSVRKDLGRAAGAQISGRCQASEF